MCIEQLIEINKLLLTPLIAIITVYIAYQQWNLNKFKFNLDRFDRRFQIYEEVKKILHILTRDEKIKKEDLEKFQKSVSSAVFMFKPEIPAYIDEISKRGFNMRRCVKKLRENDKDHIKNNLDLNNEINRELEWFAQQFDTLEIKFKKYLDISK